MKPKILAIIESKLAFLFVAVFVFSMAVTGGIFSQPSQAAGCGATNFQVEWKADAPNIKGNTFTAPPGGRTQFQARWEVPADAKPGDRFTLKLPTDLQASGIANGPFHVYDEKGGFVAAGEWRNNQEVFFTYTEYIANRRDVWVRFFQEVTWHSKYNGEQDDIGFPGGLRFEGGCAGHVDLSGVLKGQESGNKSVAGKVGDFPYQNDVNYPVDATPSRLALIRWGLHTGEITVDDYDTTWILEDTAGENQEFLCNPHPRGYYQGPSLTYHSSGAVGQEAPVPPNAVKVTCSPTHLRVEVNPRVGGIAWGNEITLQMYTKTTNGTKPGETYYNTATINGKAYKAEAQRAQFGADAGSAKDGYGSLAIRKQIVSEADASKERFTFNVTCSDGRKETVFIEGANQTVLHGIASDATCKVTEDNIPTVAGIEPKVTYSVAGKETSEVAVSDTEVVELVVTNTYNKPVPPEDPQEPPKPPVDPEDPPVGPPVPPVDPEDPPVVPPAPPVDPEDPPVVPPVPPVDPKDPPVVPPVPPVNPPAPPVVPPVAPKPPTVVPLAPKAKRELPKTGANSELLLSAGTLGVLGAGLIVLRRKYN